MTASLMQQEVSISILHSIMSNEEIKSLSILCSQPGQATTHGSAIAGTYQAVSPNGLGNQLVPFGNPYMQNYRATRSGYHRLG